MPAPAPSYDLQGALTALVPGLVIQRELLDAAASRYAAIGFVPLTSADVAPILAAVNTTDLVTLAIPPASSDSPITDRNTYPAALPRYPTGLRRFADSNPDPIDGWAKFRGGAG